MRTALPAILLLAAVPANAAPLCTNSGGRFTPCTPHDIARVKERKAKVVAKKQAVAAREEQEAIAHPERPRKVPRKPLFGIGHLCRDSKGMATPCPK